MKRFAAVSLILLPLAWAAAPLDVHAQKKMYKCGSQFQDRPCEGSAPAPAAAAKAAPAAAAPAPAPAASKNVSVEESRRQIRCENWGRQVLDLRSRENSEKNAAAAKGLGSQRAAAEARMKTDGCDPI